MCSTGRLHQIEKCGETLHHHLSRRPKLCCGDGKTPTGWTGTRQCRTKKQQLNKTAGQARLKRRRSDMADGDENDNENRQMWSEIWRPNISDQSDRLAAADMAEQDWPERQPAEMARDEGG